MFINFIASWYNILKYINGERLKRVKRLIMARGQVAVEFLITYGWAFMVILGAISTLIYLGVFDVDMFVVERCEFASNIYCVDGMADSASVSVAVQNGMAIDLQNVEVFIPECAAQNATGPSVLASGEQGSYTVTCAATVPSIFQSSIIFNYTNPDSGFNHTKVGKIIYKVN
jgi:hypothetical protein